MAATNYTPIQLYYSTTASAAPVAGNLANGELAINITDGKLYYKDNSGTVQVIATKGAGTIGGSNTQIQYNNSGALAGNAAMTFNSATSTVTLTTLNLTNALGATYGGTAQSSYTQGDLLYSSATNTLSKLGIGTVDYILTSTGSVPQWSAPSSISVLTATNLAGGAGGSVPYQSAASTTTFLSIGSSNTVMTSSGTAPQWSSSLTGLLSVSSSGITNVSLTSGRVVYSTTGGAQTDSSNLTFNGTTLSAGGYSTSGLSTLVKTVTIGNSNFDGTAVFAAATPAKLYIGTGTVTDTTSAIGATNATGAIASLAITPIAATNTSVTYTNASTLYIAGAPSAGTNITITNPYSLYVAAGKSYFGGDVVYAGGLTLNGNVTVGDSSADTLTINSTITSNLIFTDDTYDIGASGATRPRREFLSQSLYIGAPTVSWSTTTRKVLQFGNTGSAYFSASQQVTSACFGSLAWNAYGTSTDNEWKYYTGTDRANLFQIAAGGYTWYNAPVGTADATIAWTTVANLNSSGNFGLGGAPAGAYSNRRSLEILGNTVSNLSLGAAIGEITYNLYLNSGGSTLYQTNGPAAIENFNNNVSSGFAWLMAPTGTAGAGVSSLGQHMSLQRSASASILGIGSSTPTTSWEQTRAIAVGISASFFGDGESYNWPAGIVTNGYRTASDVWKYSAPTASAIPSWKFEQGNGVNGWAWDYSVTGALSSTITYTRYMYLNNSGNLGMQVSSPSYQLDMGGGTTVPSRVQLRRGSDDPNQNLLLGWGSISSTRSSVSLSNAQTTLSFDQIGSDGTRTNLYINSNGTIGIGATNTYSWDITRFKAIYFGSASSGNYFSVSQQFTAACAGGLSWNAYGSGNNTFKYMTTGDPASRLSMAGNQIRLYGAPTGTADADITFTEMLGLQKDYTVSLQGATQATGTGITFPATQYASSDANTLDDYEEGTWTPLLTFDGNRVGMTYNDAQGTYVKIGRLVYLRFGVYLSAKGSSTGAAYISNLPFASTSQSYSDPAGVFNGSKMNSIGYGMFGQAQNGATVCRFFTGTTTGTVAMTNTNFNDTSEFYGSLCYVATA